MSPLLRDDIQICGVDGSGESSGQAGHVLMYGRFPRSKTTSANLQDNTPFRLAVRVR